MGGGGGGSSQIDLSKLTGVAEERLKQLAQAGTRILFACEVSDRKALDSHLARSKVFASEKYSITDSSKSDEYLALVEKSSVIVVFTDAANQTEFLDAIAELALSQKKQGIHAKAKPDSRIPSKAMAYRWPSLMWEKLEEMFS